MLACPRKAGFVSSKHQHNFPLEAWPFADAVDFGAVTTRYVLDGDLPILVVSHETDGAWQVLCGEPKKPVADARVACLGCLYELDSSIGSVSDLPRGWIAWRVAPGAPWKYARQREDNT
jgi:hypothetical protein